jgi:hypothetical protein
MRTQEEYRLSVKNLLEISFQYSANRAKLKTILRSNMQFTDLRLNGTINGRNKRHEVTNPLKVLQECIAKMGLQYPQNILLYLLFILMISHITWGPQQETFVWWRLGNSKGEEPQI